LTEDGDAELQQKAKKLDEYVQGIFYQTNAYDIGEEYFGDWGIFGIGHIKVWHRRGQLELRRVFPNSLRVDVWDGADRRPRTIYETWLEDRDVLADMYREHEDADRIIKAIYAAPSVVATGEYAMNASTNMIEVKESFHLPTSDTIPDGDEWLGLRGRHIVALSQDDTLDDEPYNEDQFPYVSGRWNKALVGFNGMGLCELLIGHQRELNRTLQVEATSHHIMSVPRVALEINSRVNKNHVTSNKPGPVWWYQGTPPVALNWNAVTGDFVQWKEWIIQSAHDFTGISEMAAQARKPLGLDSAVAQREFKDTQSDRLSIRQKQYEQSYLELALRIIAVQRHIFEHYGDIPVQTIGRDYIKTIKWSEVSMEDDEFKLKLWPTSMLPKQPAGRLQKIQELVQAGWIDKDTGMRLLNFPDLEDQTSLMTAKQDDIKRTLDDIVYRGKYRTPDPVQDLAYGMQYGQMLYLKSYDKGLPTERLNSLLNWMQSAQATVQQATQPPPPALLPNAPQQAA
jgi:hypothetical protein